LFVGSVGYPSNVATYEYICLTCERLFEERRSMTSSVDTALACPSCGSDRVRRRFSFATTAGGTHPSFGGCGCGGNCGCGR
jgi:putative FmdB family regulatory protein